MNNDIIANIPKGLSAFIYTELSDVEDELNGFLTYDRQIKKLPFDKIKEINDKVKLDWNLVPSLTVIFAKKKHFLTYFVSGSHLSKIFIIFMLQ